MSAEVRTLDHNALRTVMASTFILLILAFVLNSPLIVAFVALAQWLGAVASPYAPFRLFYNHVLKPSGLVKPHIINDNPEPHRFSLLVGAIFDSVATIALLAGAPTFGWALVAIVVALANLNFWLNFCLGCWMYYQFNRLGVPGFTHSPVR